MLSSALIGCFTVRLNVELCSDWLFHSSARFSSSHSGKKTQGKIYFNTSFAQLCCWVIILYIICRDKGAAINMRGIETAFECTIVFYFHFRDLRSHVLYVNYSSSAYHTFYKIRCLSVVLRICKSFAIILSHLSLHCLCGKWNLMYCNVTGYC